MASGTVQPRRVANVRLAAICRDRVCWSWVDTRADRATRMGDTKPPGKWRKPTVAFPGVRGSQISGGKPLVGLTACRGDGARDTVENTPMLVCGHACGGPDGARHAPSDLPRRLSGL